MTSLNYTIVYPSEEVRPWHLTPIRIFNFCFQYDSHNYEMSLTIYESNIFFWREIGKDKIRFRWVQIIPLTKSWTDLNVYRFSITKELNGHLVVMQNYGRTETKSGESEFWFWWKLSASAVNFCLQALSRRLRRQRSTLSSTTPRASSNMQSSTIFGSSTRSTMARRRL